MFNQTAKLFMKRVVYGLNNKGKELTRKNINEEMEKVKNIIKNFV
ncbi:hypothetical protein N9C35_04060 [Flavobacteriaceae bacterium]|nr:hypothetical protein [Flavobacteriaceae bacterium]